MNSSTRRAGLVREVAGAIPIFILGSTLHFTFGWLDEWRPVALVAAVNESIWEHLKIAFWPGVLWAMSRGLLVRSSLGSFWAVRGFGLLCVSAVIVLAFHGYTALLGKNILVIDIAIFALAIVAGQAVTAILIPTVARIQALRAMGLVLLLAQIAAFLSFTFFPPSLPIFEDPRNGLSGIPAYGAPSLNAM